MNETNNSVQLRGKKEINIFSTQLSDTAQNYSQKGESAKLILWLSLLSVLYPVPAF